MLIYWNKRKRFHKKKGLQDSHRTGLEHKRVTSCENAPSVQLQAAVWEMSLRSSLEEEQRATDTEHKFLIMLIECLVNVVAEGLHRKRTSSRN